MARRAGSLATSELNQRMPALPGCVSSGSGSALAYIWPFDGWDIAAGRSAVARCLFRALESRSLAKDDQTAAQHDAFSNGCLA